MTEGFCARLQMEMSLLSPAKDGQTWWAAAGSQRRVWLSSWSRGSQLCPPEHVAVVDGPRLSVMLSLDTDNNTGACPWLFFTSPELHWGQSEVTEAPL